MLMKSNGVTETSDKGRGASDEEETKSEDGNWAGRHVHIHGGRPHSPASVIDDFRSKDESICRV